MLVTRNTGDARSLTVNLPRRIASKTSDQRTGGCKDDCARIDQAGRGLEVRLKQAANFPQVSISHLLGSSKRTSLTSFRLLSEPP